MGGDGESARTRHVLFAATADSVAICGSIGSKSLAWRTVMRWYRLASRSEAAETAAAFPGGCGGLPVARSSRHCHGHALSRRPTSGSRSFPREARESGRPGTTDIGYIHEMGAM
jgi:hypothetical protein